MYSVAANSVGPMITSHAMPNPELLQATANRLCAQMFMYLNTHVMYCIVSYVMCVYDSPSPIVLTGIAICKITNSACTQGIRLHETARSVS